MRSSYKSGLYRAWTLRVVIWIVFVAIAASLARQTYTLNTQCSGSVYTNPAVPLRQPN